MPPPSPVKPSDSGAGDGKPPAKLKRTCRQCGWKLGKADEACPWCGGTDIAEEAGGPASAGHRQASTGDEKTTADNRKRNLAVLKQLYCRDCGGKLPRGDAYCPKCGSANLADSADAAMNQWRCGDCGRKITEGSEFCPWCNSMNLIVGIPPAEEPIEPMEEQAAPPGAENARIYWTFDPRGRMSSGKYAATMILLSLGIISCIVICSVYGFHMPYRIFRGLPYWSVPGVISYAVIYCSYAFGALFVAIALIASMKRAHDLNKSGAKAALYSVSFALSFFVRRRFYRNRPQNRAGSQQRNQFGEPDRMNAHFWQQPAFYVAMLLLLYIVCIVILV
jgi:RNA polymerase subunit RPABC4/transcription elongation factor Spt4